MVREGRVFISPVAGKPEYGVGYYVTAYEVGAQVTAASSGTTATVAAGHGFAANDKFIVGTDSTQYRTVSAVTSTTLTLNSAIALAEGDLLVNLARDTGTIAPNYDGAGITIYTDMDYRNTATDNTVLTDQYGRYRYYHQNLERWELVRSDNGPIAVYVDTGDIPDVVANVRSFGAFGNGIVDDSEAIQSALDSVPAGGGKVYFPPGIYLVGAAPFIKSNTHVYGDGIGNSVIRKKANSFLALGSTQLYNPVLTCGPAAGEWYTKADYGENITVSDLTIDGNEASHTHTGGHHFAYGFSTSSDYASAQDGCIDGLVLRGIQVINSMESAIRINSCRNVLVTGCQVDSCGMDDSGAFALNGIDFYSNASDYAAGWNRRLVASNNRISNITPTSSTRSGEGIALLCGGELTLSGNDISYADFGIECNGSVMGSITISGNTIHHLSGKGSGGVGITIVPSTVPTVACMVTVCGNTVHNIGGNAINVGYVGQAAITGNTVYASNLNTLTSQLVAIDAYQCTYGSITGNLVSFASPTSSIRGIRPAFTAGGTVSGNTVIGPTSECIMVQSDATNVIVTGNTLIGGTYGVEISVYGTNSGNVVFNNIISGFSVAATRDISAQTNYIDNLNNLTVRGALAATGTFKVGAGTDATVDITFDQGTGTDPVLRWLDSGDNFRFVTASGTMDIPNRTGTLLPRVATVDATAQGANIGSANAHTVSASGRYRVSAYLVVTQAATSSSTLPKCRIGWTDVDSNTAISTMDLTATSAGNTVGTTYSYASAVISVKTATNIAYDTTSYATSGATSMQYAFHLVVEAL